MKLTKLQILRMFASSLVVAVVSVSLYTRGDVYKMSKIVKQQQNIITVLFDKRMDSSFIAIKGSFEQMYPQYRVILADQLGLPDADKLSAGELYEKKEFELFDRDSQQIISKFILVYSVKKKDGGRAFLKFLLSGEGSQILKKNSYSVREG